MGINKIKYGNNTLIDLTGDTATADKVLTGYTFHKRDGTQGSGAMANNGAVNGTINTQNGTYTVPAGYHNGQGKVTATYASGYRVVTGSYTGTSSTTRLEVSGLDFTPVGVVICLQSLPGTTNTILDISTNSAYTNPSTGNKIYGIRRNGSSNHTIITGRVSIDDKGFHFTSSSGNNFYGTYLYVAWG